MKQPINNKLREEVSKIFDNHCYFCNKDLSKKEFLDKNFHHYIPEMVGGSTDSSNLVLCCYDCHNIIHSKVKLTYGETRRIIYQMVCSLLNIIPCNYSWDDDLKTAIEQLSKDEKEVPDNWKKLIFCMKYIDHNIGLINNTFKIKDFKLLDLEFPIPKNLNDFCFLEKDVQKFYDEIKGNNPINCDNNKDKSTSESV